MHQILNGIVSMFDIWLVVAQLDYLKVFIYIFIFPCSYYSKGKSAENVTVVAPILQGQMLFVCFCVEQNTASLFFTSEQPGMVFPVWSTTPPVMH